MFDTNEDVIKAELDLFPSLCQDFRDFNVHCTVLNSILAWNIRSCLDQNGLANDKKKTPPQGGCAQRDPNKKVGGKESMGVLGLCHRLGIQDSYFVDKLLESSGGVKKDIPILMGRYDVEKFEP